MCRSSRFGVRFGKWAGVRGLVATGVLAALLIGLPGCGDRTSGQLPEVSGEAIRAKREEIKAALSQQTFAQAEFDRQSELAEKKVASTAKLEEARMGLEVARQRISAAQEELQRIEAALAGDPKIRADDHPRVRQMMAMREEALLQLRRTTIESPIDGIVSKRPVPGSYATAGVPVMVVVADTDLWIEANFKETELTRVRAGQKVLIHVDTYPESECWGTVSSISQSTGAEFAVLPPQNATGNWVKVAFCGGSTANSAPVDCEMLDTVPQHSDSG